MKIGDALNVFTLFLSIDNIHGRRRKWDRDYYPDHDGLCGFVGHSDLFYDFSLIIGILCELIDLIRYYLGFRCKKSY